MGKCAVIGGQCPETSDRTKKRYCPHWKVGIPGVVDGYGFTVQPLFTGCFLDIEPAYFVTVSREASQASAAYNQARDVVLGAENPAASAALAEIGLVMIGGSLLRKRKELAESEAENVALLGGC